MAVVNSGFTPRLSTAEPLDVPRWQDDSTVVAPNFDTTVQPISQDFATAMPTLALPDLNSISQQLIQARQGVRAQEQGMSLADKVYAQGGGGATNGGSYSGARSSGFGPSSYGFSGTTGQAKQRGSSPFGFQPKMWNALSRANAAMKAAGLGTFGITDGFRSYSQQVSVKKRKGRLAATPGRSVHGLGLASDLRLNSKQLAWLKKNGGRYGLINLPSESWHWQLDPRLA